MSDRLRILHVVHTQQFAGVEQFVRRLAIAQAAAGHSVRVIGGDAAHMSAPLDEAGVRHRPARGAAEVIRSIGLVADGLDVVNTHMTAADTVAIAAIALSRHAPALVATRHFAAPRGARLPAFAARIIENRLDAEIAISRAVADAAGVETTVVHTGVPDAEAPASPRDRVVLVAQRLEPEKQTGVAVRAFARSGLATDGWTLEIAGGGSQRLVLEREVRRLGLEASVLFLGHRDDLPAVMARARVLLAPCPNEGLGLTVLEAMAKGLVPVVAAAGGHLELLEGVDERTRFTPGDPDAAAARLRDLAADPAARDQIGTAVRARQREVFSLDAQQKGTLQVYRDAIEHRRARSAGDGA